MKLNKSQKLARSKLVKSLIVQFPRCSITDALEWADNIMQAEGVPNGVEGGRMIEESLHSEQEENYLKMKVRSRAGLPLNTVSNPVTLKSLIAYRAKV